MHLKIVSGVFGLGGAILIRTTKGNVGLDLDRMDQAVAMAQQTQSLQRPITKDSRPSQKSTANEEELLAEEDRLFTKAIMKHVLAELIQTRHQTDKQ
jgi:hypothetical protein